MCWGCRCKRLQKCGCCALCLIHQHLVQVSGMVDGCHPVPIHTFVLPVAAFLHMSALASNACEFMYRIHPTLGSQKHALQFNPMAPSRLTYLPIMQSHCSMVVESSIEIYLHTVLYVDILGFQSQRLHVHKPWQVPNPCLQTGHIQWEGFTTLEGVSLLQLTKQIMLPQCKITHYQVPRSIFMLFMTFRRIKCIRNQRGKEIPL